MTNVSPTKLPQHVLSVDVLVTYRMNSKTVGALAKADAAAADPLLSIDGCQGHMTANIPYDAGSTYEQMMAAVQADVVGRSKKVLGLGISAIERISTCAGWNAWDQVTGRNSDADDAASTNWSNGKRFF